MKQGIKNICSELKKPLIGFCGAPFTVASYMIEGGSTRHFKKTKQWLYRHPDSFHLLLQKIADWSVAYLRLQIDSGVNAIQIFDSWANTLADNQFQVFFTQSTIVRTASSETSGAIPWPKLRTKPLSCCISARS